MSSSCPRCQKSLEIAQVLESSWRTMSEEQAEKLTFCGREGWQQETVLRCPDCPQPM